MDAPSAVARTPLRAPAGAATDDGRRAPGLAAGSGRREASALVLSRGLCRPEDAAFMMGHVPLRMVGVHLWMVPPITDA